MSLSMLTALTLVLAPNPSELVAQVQRTYRAGGDMEARFSQTYLDKLRGKRRTESGRLWAKADGRVRWEYDTPIKKYFLFDGTLAYFYEPENNQVTEFERFEDSPLATALEFLLGRGRIESTFAITPCTLDCAALPQGEASVELVPKEPLAGVERVQFLVDTATGKVRRTTVVDPLGNRTDYAFSDVVFRARIDDTKMTFKLPQGVNRLRASAQPAPPPPSPKKKP